MRRSKQSILDAKARGLDVVLKPHLETENRVWRAELAPSRSQGLVRQLQGHDGRIRQGRAGGGRGHDLRRHRNGQHDQPDEVLRRRCRTGATKTYTQAWSEIIAAVRAVYSGKVTYAATYWTVKDVGFWDKVDYIGVDAYLPLTPKHADGDTSAYNPTVEAMVDAWTKPHFNPWIRDTLNGGKSAVDYYKALSEQYGKKIVFTEVGYRSLDGTATDPGVSAGGRTIRPITRSRSTPIRRCSR